MYDHTSSWGCNISSSTITSNRDGCFCQSWQICKDMEIKVIVLWFQRAIPCVIPVTLWWVVPVPIKNSVEEIRQICMGEKNPPCISAPILLLFSPSRERRILHYYLMWQWALYIFCSHGYLSLRLLCSFTYFCSLKQIIFKFFCTFFVFLLIRTLYQSISNL